MSELLCPRLDLVSSHFCRVDSVSSKQLGTFQSFSPVHSRMQLNQTSGADKHSWNKACPTERAVTKGPKVMSAYRMQPLKERVGSSATD